MTPHEHLGELVGACAKATGLREHATSDAHRALRAALADDQELTAAARARLAAIDPNVLVRDHISRWTKATLEAALQPRSGP